MENNWEKRLSIEYDDVLIDGQFTGDAGLKDFITDLLEAQKKEHRAAVEEAFWVRPQSRADDEYLEKILKKFNLEGESNGTD